MRAASLVSILLASACANGDHATMNAQPEWSGPPVQADSLEDGSMRVIITVPTGGHGISILRVKRNGDRSDVFLRLQEPTGDFVTQIVTELSVIVPAVDVEGSEDIYIWLARDGEQDRLALATPRR